jgi:vancomycin resistance protein VanJ
VLALEELTQRARGTYERELAKAYPYHTVQGTVGLWSKLPLSDTQPVDVKMDYGPLADIKPVDIKMDSTRALRTTVATDHGPLAVYVAHLGSARVIPGRAFRRLSGIEARRRSARPSPPRRMSGWCCSAT